MKKHPYSAYQLLRDSNGIRFRFFCEASGMEMLTTTTYRGDDPDRDLETAWKTEGRAHFNLCHKCGNWVCDAMYNADVLHCVDCTPWENKPKYCSRCGIRVDITDIFCRKCGVRLQYREVESDDG